MKSTFKSSSLLKKLNLNKKISMNKFCYKSFSVCKVDNPYTQKVHLEKPFVKISEIKDYINNAKSAISFLDSVSLLKIITKFRLH